MKVNNKGLFLVTVAAVIGGLMGPLIKIALREFPPYLFSFLRFLIALIIIFPFIKKENLKIKKDIFLAGIISLFAVGNIFLFVVGIRLTTAVTSSIIYAGVPVITAILSYFMLKEKFELRKISGIVISLIGVLVIIVFPIFLKGQSIEGKTIGNIIILAAVISYCFYGVLSKNLQKRHLPQELTLIFFAAVLITHFIPASYEIINLFKNGVSFNLVTIVSLVIVGVVTTLFYFLYQYIIKHESPLIASMILYFQVATGVLWSIILLGERFSLELIIGGILMLFGVWLVTKNK